MKKITQTINHSLISTISAGAILLLAPGASAQTLFVSDYATGDIYEFSTSGSISTFATGLDIPAGLAFDSEGDLFAGGQGNGDIYEFVNNNGTLNSMPTIFATGFSTPGGMAFDSAGNLYVANVGGNDIIKITTGKVQSTYASGLDAPLGIAFNSAGVLFVANSGNGTISEIISGTPTPFASGLDEPGLGMAFNSSGYLFVSDVNNYQSSGEGITEISPEGVETPFASGFGIPSGLAFNSAGNLLVGEGRSTDILSFNSNGQDTVYGTGTTDPNGLAIQNLALPVPEPSALALIAVSGVTVLSRRFRKNA